MILRQLVQPGLPRLDDARAEHASLLVDRLAEDLDPGRPPTQDLVAQGFKLVERGVFVDQEPGWEDGEDGAQDGLREGYQEGRWDGRVNRQSSWRGRRRGRVVSCRIVVVGRHGHVQIVDISIPRCVLRQIRRVVVPSRMESHGRFLDDEPRQVRHGLRTNLRSISHMLRNPDEPTSAIDSPPCKTLPNSSSPSRLPTRLLPCPRGRCLRRLLHDLL